MARDTERAGERQMAVDRETIRDWAEAYSAVPVRTTAGEARYDLVPADEIGADRERAKWDEFFEHLDDEDRVVVYHTDASTDPFEIQPQAVVAEYGDLDRETLEARLLEGETVSSTVTETAVVESVVVEEVTVESELTDSTVVDDRVVDLELLHRECTGCELVGTEGVEDRDFFDESRYLSSVTPPARGRGGGAGTTDTTTETTDTTTGTGRGGSGGTGHSGSGAFETVEDSPYELEAEVEEAWAVTRELTERFTVESHVEDIEVTETDTVEDVDVDVEGLQRGIVESGLVDDGREADEILAAYEVETEIDEDARVRTHFTRSHTVEDEVVDRRRVRATVTGAEIHGFERVESAAAATEGTGVAGASAVEPLSDREIGKEVVDAAGETVGMVVDVTDDGHTVYVDADPSIGDRIKAALDWGGTDEDDYPVRIDQIERVTREEVRLKGAEALEATPAT